MRHPVTVRIQGYVTGTLWLPAVRGAVMVDATYRLHVPTAWPFSMSSAREAVEHCCARNDGDFQTAGRLTADSLITFSRQHGSRTVSRTYQVGEHFPNALVDYIAADVYSGDFDLDLD